ncbi:hypothetical protein FoTM2_009500 [Fusarium oxysporum f. sp. vasinfectum]|uniref:GH84 domain-containing protein n=1 Tax=Fusarium oxysporum f. sp. vasinfectum 25433 TaxID=1089449 RepID=X0KMZ7_FUSOX|nr:hypothetical protein FOTG_16692 [Fusarium oxysporum f. sp. vasinfectum 25433]KAK2929161.1 hypothetical protein FoTM2_009500 [Fusarium oxysporum f. sp. vasinfectum]
MKVAAVQRRFLELVTSAFLIVSVAAKPAAVSVPEIWPTPQEQKSRPDGFQVPNIAALIVDNDTDQPALRVVQEVLKVAGVKQFITTDNHKSLPGSALHVYIGGPSENNASANALRALGLKGPDDLKAEGYALGIGRDSKKNSVVVLSGRDKVGTFYAAQSLRQLVVPLGGKFWLPSVEIRDWPSTDLRGTIEVFYGVPWSTEERLDQFDFYAKTKQNSYTYSPKDDPFLRQKWREPYPADEIVTLKKLADRAREDHIEFTFAISPGIDVCYSSDNDEKALIDKFQSLWNIGVRGFLVPFDDISYTKWNCDEDQTKWGTGGHAAGLAQADFLNRVQKNFIDTHPGAGRLQMISTEYKNTTETPYRAALREELDERIIVFWTGPSTITSNITATVAKEAKKVFGHDIFIGDNYPVNDYVCDRLLLGPYNGREAGVSDEVYGIAVNPMPQSQASKIAIFGSGSYLWNSHAYNANATWLAGLKYIGGPIWPALKVFAENQFSSALNPQESLVLRPLLEQFWTSYNSTGRDLGRRSRELTEYFDLMTDATSQLKRKMNPTFVKQSEGWLDKLGLYGKAGRTAVNMLTAQRAGLESTVRKEREALQNLRDQMGNISMTACPVGKCRQFNPTVAPGIMEPFLNSTVAITDKWLRA